MAELPLRFLLAVHNHQPVGNFESVFVRGFAECYRPFLRAVLKRPSFRFAAHYSGPLLEHMLRQERESWEILIELVRRGQVEMLGGGFYEPILSVIPERDRIGQLDMMSGFLEEHFGARPRGIWLTERVWEPTLPATLARAGIEFTLLDEEHFRTAGVNGIHASYVTEEEGRPVRIFPIDKKLRYLVPFRGLEDLREHLEPIRASGGLAILGDDGEKFGLWPGTNEWVYGREWLERFFDFLEESDVRMTSFAEIVDSEPPSGRVYLPPASYEEMLEWALPADAAEEFAALKKTLPPESRRFLRGGMFRDFFTKYPEANRLHKRMIVVSREVGDTGGPEARAELFRGQCNDPLWHGVFGGLYLPHLRESSYAHLLRAEKMSRPGADASWQLEDYDADGEAEAIIRGRDYAGIIKPHAGGGWAEIDCYPLTRNLGDVMARRREAYHTIKAAEHPAEGGSIHERAKKLPGEAGGLFRYDSEDRLSGRERFYEPGASIADIDAVAGADRARFTRARYVVQIRERSLRLSAAGNAGFETGRRDFILEKESSVGDAGIDTVVTVRNASPAPAEFQFGSEWNLYQFPAEFRVDGSRASLCGGRLSLRAEGASLRAFPIETLSQSEEGYDIIHQGYCLLALWRVDLPPGGASEVRIHLGE